MTATTHPFGEFLLLLPRTEYAGTSKLCLLSAKITI
jgi:hypothetical protein